MFWFFVCLTASSAFGAGLALAQVRLRFPVETEPPPPTLPLQGVTTRPPLEDALEELLALNPKDVVVHLGEDHWVVRVEKLDLEGNALVMAHLESPPGSMLLVSPVPQPHASLNTLTRNHPIHGQPPQVLQHAGHAWKLQKRLDAHAKPGGAVMGVHFYEGPDGLTLTVFQEAGNVTVWEGRLLELAGLMVLRPGA